MRLGDLLQLLQARNRGFAALGRLVQRGDGFIGENTDGKGFLKSLAEVVDPSGKRVVIFGAGMGMPYFSTDTTAAQRALEIKAEVVLMAKAVDGVYSADPRENPDATLYREITHREALEKQLKVADATAFSLCMDNKMPMLVFNLLEQGNIARAVAGERIGTLVSTD